jgi:UDP-glucose 4-epimerase
MSVTLVTGGAGFIGANLVPMLLARGERVRVLDNLVTGDAARLGPDVEVVEGDVRDPDALARAAAGADAVIHLAAAGSVAESVENPLPNFDVNARGTLYTLQAAADAGVERFVFASTGGALIGDAPPPVDEGSVPRPISPYGASKLAGEGYCHAFRGSYGLNTVALRFANVYGPHSDRKKGALTAFIKRALRGEPLEIYGDGEATRDFIHVDDLCAGILAAHERRDVDGVLHLASERETTIGELARMVLAATGSDATVTHLDRRRGEVERNFAIARKAADVLGWHACVRLEDGIAQTVEWFREVRRDWDPPHAEPAAHT